MEERPLPKGLAQIPQGEQVVGVKLRLAELGLELFHPVRPGGLVELCHALLDGEGPLVEMLRVVLVHHPHGVGEALQLRLLLLVLPQLLQVALLFFHRIEGVVPGIEFRLAVLQLHDPRNGLVQKVAVMGDDQHRALVMADVILQPFRGVQVQVVRRLVQEQNFSIYQNQPGQVDAGLFPAGELGEVFCPKVF